MTKKKINRLLTAINESAAAVAVLTRKASDNQQDEMKSVTSIEVLKNDVMKHDRTASVVPNEDGTVSVTTLLGPNLRYIANKHGYLMPDELALASEA